MKPALRRPNRLLLKARWLSVLFTGLLLSHFSFAQTIRYVKPGGSGNASSWATAASDLQAVINASAAGDQVWVAAGTYKPGGDANTDRTLSFSMKNGVAIYGGFVGSEQALSERPASLSTSQPSLSILSGDIGKVNYTNDNINHIVVNTNLDNTAILDGFVLTASMAAPNDVAGSEGGGMRNQKSNPIIRNCQFLKDTINSYSYGGGGMYNGDGSSPFLSNCTFVNNLAGPGGAIYSSATSSMTIVNSTFSFNDSFGGSAILGGKLTITGCTFNNNHGRSAGSLTFGGALTTDSNSILTNCLFAANSTQGKGGAIYINGNSTLTNCTFRGNLTDGYGTAANRQSYGGAVYIYLSYPIFTNCSFSNNVAIGFYPSYNLGGAVYNEGGKPKFLNCSFGNNKSAGPGGAIYTTKGASYNGSMYVDVNGVSIFTNCIVWGNMPDNISNNTGGDTQFTYSDIQNPMPGVGNISADPLFVDAAGDNLRLKSCSPAIDNGDNSVQAGSVDVNGSPRRIRTIDMGAYEFQGTPLGLATITQQPNTIYSVPQGGTLTATISTSGSITAYQWYKDGVALTGVASVTTATLQLTNLMISDQGSYSVVITGTCNSATSNTFRLLVNTGMYTLKAGSWDDPSIWSLSRLPLSSDKVLIKHIVTVPAGYVAHAAKVSFDIGQRLRLGQASRVRLNQ